MSNTEIYPLNQLDPQYGYELRTTSSAIAFANEPITLEEFARYSNTPVSTDNAEMLDQQAAIATARLLCENYLSKDIVGKTYELFLDVLGSTDVKVPNGPILLNRDDDGVLTNFTVTSEGRTLTEDTEFELIGLDDPLIRFAELSAGSITITYSTIGITDVAIKEAVKRMATNLYETRNDSQSEELFMVPMNVQFLLTPFKSGASIIL